MNEIQEQFNAIYRQYSSSVYAYFNICFGFELAEDLSSRLFSRCGGI